MSTSFGFVLYISEVRLACIAVIGNNSDEACKNVTGLCAQSKVTLSLFRKLPRSAWKVRWTHTPRVMRRIESHHPANHLNLRWQERVARGHLRSPSRLFEVTVHLSAKGSVYRDFGR